MESAVEFNRPETSRSSRIDVLRSTLNNFRSKTKKSPKSPEPDFLVKGKNFSTTSTNFTPVVKEGLSLEKFFGASFKILNINETPNLKEFNASTTPIPDLLDDPEEQMRRARRNNFEINETDEDLCTESNIGSSLNASRLNSRKCGQFEERKKCTRANHYRAKEKANLMYKTSYNADFFQKERTSFKPLEKRAKLNQDDYFQYHRKREKEMKNKVSREYSQNSKEEESLTFNFNERVNGTTNRIISSFSSTNTKGFYNAKKEKNFYNTRANFGSTRNFPKKLESRSIFTFLEENNQEMTRKYGKKGVEAMKEIPSDSSLINKYKEKFKLTESEYDDWSGLVQIKTLNRPVNPKRESLDKSLNSRASTMKEIITQ